MGRAKKSKKKNKKKDRESESEDEDKENRKKKKKSKKRKDKESEGEEDEEQEENKEGETMEQKSLVPYDEAEEPKTNEESVDEDGQEKAEQEKEEEKPKMDPTKFINSFSETVVEEVKPKLKLPTLIFNEKTVELAPREEIKPETEVSEDKIAVHKENTPEPITNPSRAQNLATDSKKQQDKPAERS